MGKYYFTRNASTIVAFAIGSKYAAGNGFHMIGAHTDRYMIRIQFLYTSILSKKSALW